MDVKEKKRKEKRKETKIVKVYVCACILFYLFVHIFFNDKIANILKKNLIF